MCLGFVKSRVAFRRQSITNSLLPVATCQQQHLATSTMASKQNTDSASNAKKLMWFNVRKIDAGQSGLCSA